MIFFSVIIPTYNRAGLIIETLNTVLAQSYSNFEVIVVDDGSSDNTREVIEEKYRTEPRVKYFYKENGERGAARNFGMRHAKGEYAIIFDSDDWMHEEHLSVLNGKINKIPVGDINFIATKYQLKEDSGKIVPGGTYDLREGWYDYKRLLKGNLFGCMYAVRLNNPGLRFFSEDRMYSTLEDWMFILENLRYDRIYLIDQITIMVRHNETRSTANNQRVIKVRKLAQDWILKNVALSKDEQRTLKAWSYYYCGIHQYLDHNRAGALRETWKAIITGGINKKFLTLFAKSVIGRKIIKAIQ